MKLDINYLWCVLCVRVCVCVRVWRDVHYTGVYGVHRLTLKLAQTGFQFNQFPSFIAWEQQSFILVSCIR